MKNVLKFVVAFALVFSVACEDKKEGGADPTNQGSQGGGSGGSGNPGTPGGGSPGNGDDNGSAGETPVPNTPPVAVGADLTIKQGAVLSVTPQGQDADGDVLVYSIETQPTHGTISVVGGNFTYTADASYVGLDQFTYKASDSIDTSAPATVKIFIMNSQPDAAFWLRAEDIQSAGTDGEVITDWKDSVSGNSAHFEDADRTPRFISQLAPGVKGVQFEFTTGSGSTNDFISYPNTYAYSQTDGLTFIAVGEALSFSDAISPVLSFGDWINEGLGFNWSSTHAGVATPLAHGGADNKDMLTVSSGGLSIFVSQIRFSSPASNNGFQRARMNGGTWPAADTTLGVTKITAAEIAEQAMASAIGSPIMIGANNHFATQPNQRFSGKLGEVILMNRFLSNSELRVIENYLKAKFAIP